MLENGHSTTDTGSGALNTFPIKSKDREMGKNGGQNIEALPFELLDTTIHFSPKWTVEVIQLNLIAGLSPQPNEILFHSYGDLTL